MRDLRLCFIGESVINGTNDPEFRGWVGRVCAVAVNKDLGITAYNLGVRGPTSVQIAKSWEDEVNRRLSKEAGYEKGILFSFGVRDTVLNQETQKRDVEPDDSEKNARKILEAASRTSFPILMIGPPPVVEAHRIQQKSRADPKSNEKIEDLSQRFGAVCKDLDVPYLDVFTPLRISSEWMDEVAETDGDGFHPKAKGYAKFAQLVQGWRGWLDLIGR